MMLKISEFSKLSQVSIKTLHHYDEIGILRPEYVDPVTSYRFYTLEQLPRIHRIMALKEFGLSLEQINIMLQDDIESSEMRAMLKLKKTQVEQQVREETQRLSRIEFHLKMLEAEENFPKLDVVMKPLDPMRVLSLYVEPFHTKFGMVDLIKHAVSEGKIQFTGSAYDVFYGEKILPLGSPELEPRQHEILLSVEEDQKNVTIEQAGDWEVRDQSGFPLAATVMLTSEGEDFIVFEKVILLQRWAIENGYQPLEQVRYLHHRGPFQTMERDQYIFEAQIPIKTS